MVNDIWWEHPLLQDFSVQNIGKFYAFDFLTLLLKFFLLKNFQDSSCPRELSRDLFSTGGKRTFAIFEGLEHILQSFQYFFIKSLW